jgi:hypothetical protein
MARKGAILIIGIIALLIIGGGAVGVNAVLESNFNISLIDIVTAVIDSGNTLESAPSLDEVSGSIDASSYSQLNSQKSALTGAFTAASQNINELSENQELVDMLNNALGSEYNIYLFTVAEVGGVEFKVFEWSIKWANSSIAVFEEGMTLPSYNVRIQADQSIINTLMSGNAGIEDFTDWVKNKKIKINPILETARLINALPQLFSLIQSP